MSAHTPLQWKAELPHNAAGDTHVSATDSADGASIIIAWNCRPHHARLIAAAPEMAERLRDIMHAYEVGSASALEVWIKDSRALLAKAGVQ